LNSAGDCEGPPTRSDSWRTAKKIIGIVPRLLSLVISRWVVKAGEDELARVIENELMTLLERQK